MSTQDKAKNAAEKGTGKIKEQLGKRPTTNPLKPKASATRTAGDRRRWHVNGAAILRPVCQSPYRRITAGHR
jgi:hypothetical protein